MNRIIKWKGVSFRLLFLIFLIFDLMTEIIITFLLAMAPISELRGAIPYAWLKGINPWHAYLIAVIGNIVPVIPLLLVLEPISNFLRKNKFMDKFFIYIFKHAKRRSRLIEKYESIGLALLVGIPLPMTGAWTGSIIAYLLKIKFRDAFISIAIGVMLAGIIVSFVCLGIVRIPIFLKTLPK